MRKTSFHLSPSPDHHAVNAVDDDDGHDDERRGLEHGRRINIVVVPTSYAIRHDDQTSSSFCRRRPLGVSIGRIHEHT